MPVIPIPKYEPGELYSDNGQRIVTKEWVDWYLNVPNWKCKACGLTMFGRSKRCHCGVTHEQSTTPNP